MSESAQDALDVRPWSTKAPQRWFFVAAAVVLGVAVVVTAVTFIAGGSGGVVPFLMLTVAPVLAVVYVWYFGFKRW